MEILYMMAQNRVFVYFTPSPLRGTPPKISSVNFRGRAFNTIDWIAVPLFFAEK